MGRPKKVRTEGVLEVKSELNTDKLEYFKYIKNTEEFKSKVIEYFSNCSEDQRFPTFAGLRLYLGITVTELEAILKSESSKEINRILEMSKDMRDECLSNIMLQNPKLAPTCMSMMKQTWFDMEQDNQLTIVLKVDGLTDPNNFIMR